MIDEAADKKDTYYGRTRFDAPDIDGRVVVKSAKRLLLGSVVNVSITKTDAHDLWGNLA